MSYSLLVRRVLRHYDPLQVLALQKKGSLRRRVLSSDPIRTFKESGQRSDAYHFGRIRFFCNELQSNRSLEPVEIDNIFDHHGVSNGFVLCDGHHRLIAAMLTKTERIFAYYGGLELGLDWLRGIRRYTPLQWR